MKTILLLAALLLVLVIALVLKRRAVRAKVESSETLKASENPTLEPPVAASAEVSRPEVVENEVSSSAGKASSVERMVALNSESRPSDIGRPAASSPKASEACGEKIPEDSMLRRHYQSTRDAEKQAIVDPYPTDATLRRHRESLSASDLRKGLAARPLAEAAQTVRSLNIPEDSVLKRHFLAHVQAEVESQLSARPTDSALRRHYDSLVKAKMEGYSRAA